MNILDCTSRLSCIKSRWGLNISTKPSATSKYIEEVKIRRTAIKHWTEIREEFEKEYSNHKGFDYLLVSDLNAHLKGLMEIKLLRLRDQMDVSGKQAVWDFVFSRMKMKKGVLKRI